MLGQKYGLLARSMLSYDFVFLAMLLARPEDMASFETHRCPICPLRKKQMCVSGAALEQAADLMVILSWWKLRDNVQDSAFFPGLPSRVLSWLLKPSYRKAARIRPHFASEVQRCLEQLRELEQSRSASIDRTAGAFAELLAASAAAEPEPRRRALEQVLYHVGRWIYLVDAVEDLEEDQKRGSYNPVALRFQDPEERDTYLRTNLLNSLNLARGAFELLPRTAWSEICANILYLGLPMVEQAVYSGQWKEIKKLIGRRN